MRPRPNLPLQAVFTAIALLAMLAVVFGLGFGRVGAAHLILALGAALVAALIALSRRSR